MIVCWSLRDTRNKSACVQFDGQTLYQCSSRIKLMLYQGKQKNLYIVSKNRTCKNSQKAEIKNTSNRKIQEFGIYRIVNSFDYQEIGMGLCQKSDWKSDWIKIKNQMEEAFGAVKFV